MTVLHKLAILAAVLGALWGLHALDKYYAIKEVNTSWEDKLKQANEKAQLQEEFLANHFIEKDRLKDEKFKSVERSLNRTIDGLRKRANRPDRIVTITEGGETCTGAQLYREDAEFLAREAARAERVRIERDDLYERYEEARIALERLNDGEK